MNTTLLRRTGTAVAVTGAIATARRLGTERSDRRFMHVDPAKDTFHEVGHVRFRLPATWHRTDGFVGYWAADLEAVKALLPTPQLYPVRIDRDHALMGAFAFRHFEIAARDPDGATMSLPAYGEAGVYCAVTRRSMPPFVPVLLERAAGIPMGGYILQLPVTARFHRDGGRAIWGYPKFLADMEFADEGTTRSVHVAEGDRAIMDLQVEVGGGARWSRAPSVIYSVLDGRLIETTCPSRAVAQQGFRARGQLTLGDHPAVSELRDLGIIGRPVAAGMIDQQRFVMPAGNPIGPARSASRYAGSEDEFARFVTRHADGTVVDHSVPASSANQPGPYGRAKEMVGV